MSAHERKAVALLAPRPPGTEASDGVIETDVSQRLDRLPWGRFHTLVVAALGITWILDGLEVTLVGALAGALEQSPVLKFSATDIGFASSAYLAGAVLGAVFFGWLTDRLGRRKLFFITLTVYLVATAATALSWNLASFALFRFLTGMGIGGEYAAINSTIQELVPPRVRGWTDLVINGSFWIGAALGAAGSIVLLDPALFATDIGWRLAFAIGAVLSVIIFFMRLWIPESPRWLVTHGRTAEAEAIVAEIEARFRREGHRAEPGPVQAHAAQAAHAYAVVRGGRRPLSLAPAPGIRRPQPDGGASLLLQRHLLHLRARADALLWREPPNTWAGTFCPLPSAIFSGPLLLGRLFDIWGRRVMLASTYAALRPAAGRNGLPVLRPIWSPRAL